MKPMILCIIEDVVLL